MQFYESSAQNPFRAEDFCSIIIETLYTEGHRKPREVLEMSLFCSMLMLIPLSGDSSGISLGVRSVALLQVA